MKKVQLLLLAFLCTVLTVTAQEKDSSNLRKFFENTNICGQWFIGHQYNHTVNENRFFLKRGYFGFKKKLNDVFSVRYTQDITLDPGGKDAGNVETRLKYLYISISPFKKGIFKDSWFEAGMIHRPWLDYEQSINHYRAEGTMFAERQGLLNSADFGVNFSGYIGGKLNKTKAKKTGLLDAGRYGSYSLGVYNGPGYHASEKNNNKTIEGRLSLRPVPKFLPGLRFSYSFVQGKGNLPGNVADFTMNLFFMSSQSRYHSFTAQYIRGKGNSSGTYYNLYDNNPQTKGYSFFGEIKHPKTNFSIFGRYDKFRLTDPESNNTVYKNQETIIAGVSYQFLKNKVLANYNHKANNHETFEIVLETKF